MDNDQRVQLRVLGISYTQLQMGAFALIMAQVNGPYRIPIMIGEAEAKSITIAFEGIDPPRPLTHDLLLSILNEMDAQLVEVFIYKFDNGVFSSELTISTEGRTFTVDSRTSDAVALAVRTSAPIWTTPEIISEAGFIINASTSRMQRPDAQQDDPADDAPQQKSADSLEQLEQLLKKMVEDENYEEAARITKIIEERKKQNKP